jgi:hypothetical protein
MYSAAAGQTALDRTSDADPSLNSVYTRTLLPLLTQSGRSLADIAREVRVRVRDLALQASHEQTPAYYDELVGDVYLAGAPPAGAAAAKPPPAASQPIFESNTVRHRGSIDARIADFIEWEFLRDKEQFADVVDYYDKGSVDRAFIAQDKADYAIRWPVREYRLIPGTLSTVGRGPNTFAATFAYTFTLANGTKRKSGRGRTQVVLHDERGTFWVVAVREAIQQ